jgi:hypothetical protein
MDKLELSEKVMAQFSVEIVDFKSTLLLCTEESFPRRG